MVGVSVWSFSADSRKRITLQWKSISPFWFVLLLLVTFINFGAANYANSWHVQRAIFFTPVCIWANQNYSNLTGVCPQSTINILSCPHFLYIWIRSQSNEVKRGAERQMLSCKRWPQKVKNKINFSTTENPYRLINNLKIAKIVTFQYVHCHKLSYVIYTHVLKPVILIMTIIFMVIKYIWSMH